MTAEAGAYLDALRRGDRRLAFGVVDGMIERGSDIGGVYMDVVQPAMREIGRLWQENVLSVAEEHLATAITQAAMGRVFERVFEWKNPRSPHLIAACADDERHQMGLRMLCDLLELDGWDTTYLGASVPIESLVELIRKHPPDAVALSATIAPHIPQVRDAIAAIRRERLPRQPLIAVGGRAFHADAALAKRIGADLTADDAASAVRILNKAVAAR